MNYKHNLHIAHSQDLSYSFIHKKAVVS